MSSLKQWLSHTGIAMLLIAGTSSVATAEQAPISGFLASYEIDWDGGLSMSGDTTRELKKTTDNQWYFESKASAMFASVKESSLFQWQQPNQLQPLQYQYKRSVLGKKRQANVNFNWENLTVTNDVENKPWQMDIQPGVQDKISYQLLLQAEVAQGKTEFKYQVADGGRLKDYTFKVDGEEQIKAPIGEYNAIRVKRVRNDNSNRQTFIWFAPALNYQIIKLHQIEKKDKAYTLLLKSLSPTSKQD